MGNMKKIDGVYHKAFYASDMQSLSDGDIVFDIFLLSEARYCSNERAAKWLNIRLEDRSGSIRAKIWSDRLKMEYEGYTGGIVIVRGRVAYYAGRPELTVEQMMLAKEGEYELTEIVRVLSPERIESCSSQLEGALGSIENKELQNFVSEIITSETIEQFSVLPVTLNGHHAYRGGLLEHICEVTLTAFWHWKAQRPFRNMACSKDLVLAGALLHDIGVLNRFEPDGYGFVDKKNKLFGMSYAVHTALFLEQEKKKMDSGVFAELMHVIDSAHEGGPAPRTMEAMIVRSANKLSAEQEIYENAWATGDLTFQNDQEFIYVKSLGRELYRPVRRGKDAD